LLALAQLAALSGNGWLGLCPGLLFLSFVDNHDGHTIVTANVSRGFLWILAGGNKRVGENIAA